MLNYSIRCVFPAQTPQFFILTVQSNYFLADLEEAIRNKLKSLCNANISEISLLKVNFQEHIGETDEALLHRVRDYLQQHSSDARHAPLPRGTSIDCIFPPEDMRENVINLLIFNAEVLELTESLATLRWAYRKGIRDNLTQTILNMSPSLEAPSNAIKDAKNVKQLITGGPVYINRVPVALFNSALAKLQQNIDNPNFPVSPIDVKKASEYIARATQFYASEDERERGIKSAVDSALRSKGTWGQTLDWADNIRPDGLWKSKSGNFFVDFLELKNVPGLQGDPKLQCAGDLLKVVRSDKYKDIRGICNFPAVFIGIAGSRLQVSIAVYIGAVLVSDLVEIDLSCLGFHASDVIIRVARIFTALSLCHEDLKAYYASIERQHTTPLDISFLFPQPISATKAQLPNIIYDRPLDPEGRPTEEVPDFERRSTALYLGTFVGKQVLIKFTRRYNETAHRALEVDGLAPKLYFCGDIVGNLCMVVMEYIPQAKCLADHVVGAELLDVLPLVIEKAERAIDLLHQRNIVFGHLGYRNIMVYGEHDTKSVMLVDFDWAGTPGVDHYSAAPESSTDRYDGVLPYSTLEKGHDLGQIEQLKTTLADLEKSLQMQGVQMTTQPATL
ncbi:hypothetical protein D9613_009476 [Agrocybe pediades]|uniref:Protein kinase domain-containing protein n=1 Tax=Agrocybe pediades TaxID=84607 RepID=A0A8H4R2Y0_9AGAR|nr:hypothetical protein D9613_009476 [Agrocybe pediades]